MTTVLIYSSIFLHTPSNINVPFNSFTPSEFLTTILIIGTILFLITSVLAVVIPQKIQQVFSNRSWMSLIMIILTYTNDCSKKNKRLCNTTAAMASANATIPARSVTARSLFVSPEPYLNVLIIFFISVDSCFVRNEKETSSHIRTTHLFIIALLYMMTSFNCEKSSQSSYSYV